MSGSLTQLLLCLSKSHCFPGWGQFLGPTLNPPRQNSGTCGRQCGTTTGTSSWTGSCHELLHELGSHLLRGAQSPASLSRTPSCCWETPLGVLCWRSILERVVFGGDQHYISRKSWGVRLEQKFSRVMQGREMKVGVGSEMWIFFPLGVEGLDLGEFWE